MVHLMLQVKGSGPDTERKNSFTNMSAKRHQLDKSHVLHNWAEESAPQLHQRAHESKSLLPIHSSLRFFLPAPSASLVSMSMLAWLTAACMLCGHETQDREQHEGRHNSNAQAGKQG